MSSVRPTPNVPEKSSAAWRWNISPSELEQALSVRGLRDLCVSSVGMETGGDEEAEEAAEETEEEAMQEEVFESGELEESFADEVYDWYEEIRDADEADFSAENTQERNMRDLKTRTTALLLEAADLGVISDDLKNRIDVVIKGLRAFFGKYKLAEQMSNYLSSTLEGLPMSTREGGDPLASGRRTSRIVGRKTLLIPGTGRKEHSFLVSSAPRSYVWKTTRQMRQRDALRRLYDEYPFKEDKRDAEGQVEQPLKGWAEKILDARGEGGEFGRRYRVEWWTADPLNIPARVRFEWVSRSELLPGAVLMANEFDARNERGAESDDEGPMVEEDKEMVLRWDPSGGRPKLSLRRAVSAHKAQPWTLKALKEYTVNRIWALKSRTPPQAGLLGAPTTEEMETLGKDLFRVYRKSMVAVFRRERAVMSKERAERRAEREDELMGEEEEDAFESDDEDAFAKWQERTEENLSKAALNAWDQTRAKHAPQLLKLEYQLKALKILEEEESFERALESLQGEAPRRVDLGGNILRTLNDWYTKGASWPSRLAYPALRLPVIRDFLMPGRSETARNWLKLQREEHEKAKKTQIQSGVMGSAYSASWPRYADATSTPADHVVPVRWFEGGSKLLMEAGDPAQLPAVVMSRLEENSAKGDNALLLFSEQGEADRGGQGAYMPQNVSEAKKEMLSRIVAWVWLMYPLISNKKTSVGIGAYADSTGCDWYGRAWDNGRFQEHLKSTAKPGGFERRVALLSLGMTRWQVANPLIFDPTLLDDAAKEVLRDRFWGRDALSNLVDEALRQSVASAPGPV